MPPTVTLVMLPSEINWLFAIQPPTDSVPSAARRLPAREGLASVTAV